MVKYNRLGTTLAGFGLAAAVASAPLQAHALTVDVEFTASSFLGIASYWLTHEPVPQNEVSGSFTIETDVVPDPTEGANIYTAPTAGDISIAGFDYGLEELTAYVGYIGTRFDMIQVGGTGPPGASLGPVADGTISAAGPAVHAVTSGTDDFVLVVSWDESGNLIAPMLTGGSTMFTYSTAATVSGFWPWVLTVTASVDGAIPQQVTMAETLPDTTVCLGASPGGPVDGGVWVGHLLCYPPESESEGEGEADRAASAGSPRLREVKTGNGSRAHGEVTEVETALGSLTLVTRPVGRRMLRANEGTSAAVEPPADAEAGALDCAKAKIAPGTVRFRPIRNVITAGAVYHIGAPSRLCVDPSGASGGLLCHRARRALKSAGVRTPGDVWVAHALGTEELSVGRAREICLPIR